MKRKIKQTPTLELPDYLYEFLTTGREPAKDDEHVWEVAFLTPAQLSSLWLLHKDTILKTWKGKKLPWAQLQCEKNKEKA